MLLEGTERVYEGNIGKEPVTLIIQSFQSDSPGVIENQVVGHYYFKKDEISNPITGTEWKDGRLTFNIIIESNAGVAELKLFSTQMEKGYQGTITTKNKLIPVRITQPCVDSKTNPCSRLANISLLKLNHKTPFAETNIVVAWPLDMSAESNALRAFTWENLLSLESLGEEDANTSKYVAMPAAEDVDIVVQQMKRIDRKMQLLSNQYLTDGTNADTNASGMQYSLDLYYKRDFSSSKFQNYSYANYQFTGGAHGMYGYVVLSMNAQTGNPIDGEKVLSPEILPKIPTLLKKYYLASQNAQLSPPSKPYKSLKDLLFVEEFPGLGPNSYCTDLGLTTYWGLYEIAPYSSGIVSVTIPWKELK